MMTAPYRITRKDRRLQKVSFSQGNSDEAFREYLSRLIKLIPSEVISLYLAGSGVIPQNQATGLIVWSGFCVFCVFVVRVYGSSPSTRRLDPQWKVVAISIISFLIWLYTLGGPFEAIGIYVPPLGTILVLSWTFLIPYIYKGEVST